MGGLAGKTTQIQMQGSGSPAPQASAVPGKTTLTEQVAGNAHEMLNQKCDVAQDGCFLSATDQTRLERLIDSNLTIAAVKWVQALTDKRLALLLDKKEGWSAFFKIATTVALGFATEGAEAGLEYLAEEVESTTAMRVIGPIINRQESVKGVMEKGSELVGERAGESAAEAANEDNQEAANMLATLREQPGNWASGVIKSYPKALDHYGMLLLYGLSDPVKILTADHFTNEINKLLERWEKQVHAVGDRNMQLNYTQTVGWIWPLNGTIPRLARISVHSYNSGLPDELSFVAWVDEDMQSMSLEQAKEKDAFYDAMLTLDKMDDAPTDRETQLWNEGRGSTAASEDPVDYSDEVTHSESYSHEDPIKKQSP